VQWEARALSNRGLLHTTRRSFAAAEADLEAAGALCAAHDLGFSAAYVEQNLGWVKAQRGDIPAALHHFDLAAAHYQSLGIAEGSLLVDRAELLLSVRLVAEARATAEQAVAAFQEHDRVLHVPEAQLLLASVALAQQDSLTASTVSDQALRGFRRHGRSSWAALARWTHLRSLNALQPGQVAPSQARRAADELSAAGWTVYALEARVLAAQLALKRGQTAQARRDLARASRARTYGPAEARARAWLAEALLRREDGRRRSATAAVAAGLRVVEQHRATLGATELRAHASVHRGALARLGLRMALEDGQARRVLTWAERGRASAALMRSAHPPRDPVLAQLLADLRATLGELDEARKEGEPTAAFEARQISLEHSISEHCRKFPGAAGPEQVRVRTPSDLAADLGAAALVEFVEQDGHLAAVTLAGGRAQLRWLGPLEPISQAMGQVAFALHRLSDPRRPAASVAAATTALGRARSRLDELLLLPLAGQLHDRPLVVVPTPSLQSLPWSVLPSCTARPVTVAPSATLWHQAFHRRQNPGPPLGAGGTARVVAVAGPGLPGAREEAEAVAGLHLFAELLTGEQATAPKVAAAMDHADLVHVAAHGRLRSDNPQFSALLLADGPYTVYDLERLAAAPRHVVLAACETGRTVSVAGEEILGLTAALLAQGTATLVAPVVPVPDAETVDLMVSYHANLLAGRAPAEALALAQEQASSDIVSRVAAAGFVCLGDGTRSLRGRQIVRPPAEQSTTRSSNRPAGQQGPAPAGAGPPRESVTDAPSPS
jgi:hypothetical protein